MVKRSLYRSGLLSKLEKNEDKFFENLAKDFLTLVGNSKPTKTHIKEMKLLISETEVKRVVSINNRLTIQEKKCLFLASKGKTIKQTAKIINTSFETAREYRASAIKKLKAVNLPSAVALGIKYNQIRVSIPKFLGVV